jgi:hypothetical protein
MYDDELYQQFKLRDCRAVQLFFIFTLLIIINIILMFIINYLFGTSSLL